MERREFLKLTLGFTAAAGSIAAMASGAAQAAPMLPPIAEAVRPESTPPDRSETQARAESAPDELNAAEPDEVDMSARRRWWRRRRRVFVVRRRRRWGRRRRVIYY